MFISYEFIFKSIIDLPDFSSGLNNKTHDRVDDTSEI